MPAESDIRFETRGRLGLVTLDRGRALNALSHAMVLALDEVLDRWEADPEIAHIVIRSADEKAFSAGGDIRELYEEGLRAKRGEAEKPTAFFDHEYRLNIRIKTYPKPYIALVDGIVMGGGVGVSVNGRHRVAGPNIRFAMPEVGIGFFPDVGGTWFLPRLPGETGAYLALTGARLDQADCCWSGIATQAGD
ncbi:MAG TPA: enoyl-CoA hydratase/isomerase family protein, partial [Afifellaceae bacterium]|nr:enoyl-CoA hydratase/isomerase family protein [Afifellaceae bacterium]